MLGSVVRSRIQPRAASAPTVWYASSQSTRQVNPAAVQIRYWVRWYFSFMWILETGDCVFRSQTIAYPSAAASTDVETGKTRMTPSAAFLLTHRGLTCGRRCALA